MGIAEKRVRFIELLSLIKILIAVIGGIYVLVV